jgi:glycosyltransferase involved in cell wall biosynthesis
MPLVTVIVVIYSAEKYLRKCLDSLICQTLNDFELILVDDGCIDGSVKICDEYAEQDTRIKIIHKKNGGVGSARQCGVENASGEYVIHVDPDDWVESTMLEEMYCNAVENLSDMVFCDYIQHLNDGCVYKSQRPKSIDPLCIMRELFLNLHSACWNKLIRRELFKKFDLSFPANMVVWEDLFMCVNLLSHDIRISYMPKAYYHYVSTINENSLVRSVSRRKLDSMCFFIDYFEKNISGFDKTLFNLNKRKIEAKRTAFLIKNMKKNEFYQIYPEIDELFIVGFEGFKKIDALVRFALRYSWSLSRVVLLTWWIKNYILNRI